MKKNFLSSRGVAQLKTESQWRGWNKNLYFVQCSRNKVLNFGTKTSNVEHSSNGESEWQGRHGEEPDTDNNFFLSLSILFSQKKVFFRFEFIHSGRNSAE